MSAVGLVLVLTAAFCHAVWNYFVKQINSGPELIWLFSLLSTAAYVPIIAWVLLVEQPTVSLLSFVFIVGSVVLHLGYFLLLQAGYRNGDLSLVYPTARATGPLLATVLAVLLLGEVVPLQTGAGALIIISGVFMLTGGVRAGAQNVNTSLLFGVGAGILIGGYTVWDAYAVSVLLAPPLLLDSASSVGRVILLAPIAHRRRKQIRDLWRRHRWRVAAIAVFNPLAYVLVLYAMTFTPVSYVAPLREASVLLTVLAGSLLLGEGDLRRRLAWSMVIFSGMVMVVSA